MVRIVPDPLPCCHWLEGEVRCIRSIEIIDARDGIRISDQVASRGRKDFHTVAEVARGEARGQQAYVIPLESDFRSLQCDSRIEGADEGKRLDNRTIGSGRNRDSRHGIKINRDQWISGKTWGGRAINGHLAGDGRERGGEIDRSTCAKDDNISLTGVRALHGSTQGSAARVAEICHGVGGCFRLARQKSQRQD